MILQSLREMALREGLVDDPAFESKPVRWVIDLKLDGTFRGAIDTNVTPIAVEGKKGKPRPEAKMMVIPRRSGRSSNIASDFLVDNAKYAMGIAPDGIEVDEKTLERHAAFVKMLEGAQAEVHDPLLAAVLKFLADRASVARCAAALQEQDGFASNDLFTFCVDDEFLNEAESLRAWWEGRAGVTEAEASGRQCLLCGETKPLAGNHAQLQIRGGVTSGVPLVSFNTQAFEKYGWSGNQNAPFCQDCMTAYAESLRRLTRSRYIIARSGETVTPLSTSLTADTTAIYWTDGESDFVGQLPFLRDDPKRVADLLFSPHRGSQVRVANAQRFFCLILTGAQGRAIVRKVHTGTVEEVQQNLRRYFEAIDVDRFDRSIPIPLYRLLQSMAFKGEIDRLAPDLGTDLWLAAVFGLPLSRALLATVVGRNRAEQKVTPERVALLQFYFAGHDSGWGNSVKQTQRTTKENARPMSLDRTSTNKAYLLGRLLAVLENLQTAAQGQNLNRTIVDRFFGAASTRPGVVFPQLVQLAQHHMAKAGRNAAGRAVNLDKQLGEIIDGLNANEGFGATLNLEEQGRFAIGYYHQRQSFFRKSEAGPNPESMQGENAA